MTSEFAASVVLVTGDGAEALAGILSRLRRQTIARQLEVIFVTRPECADAISALRPNEFSEFVVLAGDLSTSARGRAQGVRAARADIVIFAEDHSFPLHDDWAERLVVHFDEGYAGVGPVVRNANPGTAASWGTLAIEYTHFLSQPSAGVAPYIAGHNSAYRRELLLGFGDDLPAMLESEWRLQNELRAGGHTFLMDPEIETAHMNYSRLRPSFRLHYLAGRMFAASRREGWGPARRIAFALAAPAIFLKRLIDVSARCLASDAAPHLPRALPVMIGYLAASAAGEAMGYATGTGGRESDLAEMEYSRWRNVLPKEADLQMKPIE